MNQAELIQFVTDLGADVFTRQLSPEAGETVSVMVERIPEEDNPTSIPGWKHTLYLLEDHEGWTIHYIQSGRTRPLLDPELKQLLTEWIHEPDSRIFKDYNSA